MEDVMNKLRIKTISLFTSFLFGMALLLQPVVSFAMTLDELIAAAQKEGEVNTYWHSSRMGKKVAKAFEEKYGIKVNATKMKDSEMTERIVREVSSGNVIVDLVRFYCSSFSHPGGKSVLGMYFYSFFVFARLS